MLQSIKVFLTCCFFVHGGHNVHYNGSRRHGTQSLGCTKISADYDNCYAERFAERLRGVKGRPFKKGFDPTLHLERLDQVFHWRQGKKSFPKFMSDLSHNGIPRNFVDQVFYAMGKADQHAFQVFTKKSSRMRGYINARYSGGAALEHIWLGAPG